MSVAKENKGISGNDKICHLVPFDIVGLDKPKSKKANFWVRLKCWLQKLLN